MTAAAAGLSLAEAAGEGMDSHEAAMFLVGSVSSGVVGYLAIRFLLGFLANHSLKVFAYYRFALAAHFFHSSGSLSILMNTPPTTGRA